MVLSSITTIRPLKIPLIENERFQYTPFWIAKNGPDGLCRQLVLIAGKSPHQPDTNGQFI